MSEENNVRAMFMRRPAPSIMTPINAIAPETPISLQTSIISNLTANNTLREVSPTPGPGPQYEGAVGHYELTKPISKLSPAEIAQLNRVGFNITAKDIANDLTYQHQINALGELRSANAVTMQNGQITLKTPMNELPDNLYKDAVALGFGAAKPKGVSSQAYDWLNKEMPNGLVPWIIDKVSGRKTGTTKGVTIGNMWVDAVFGPETAEAAAVPIGSSERTFEGAANFLTNSNNFDYRTVSPDTISYTKKMSKEEQTSLGVLSLGGTIVSNYVMTAPIGVATDMALAGASKISSTLRVGIGKVSRMIGKHPDLARMIMYGTAVGMSAPEIADMYKRYQKGETDFDHFMFRIAEMGVGIAAGVKGFEAGGKFSRQLRNWYNTRSIQTKFPAETLMSERNIKGGKLYSYPKDLKPKDYANFFKVDARTNLGEEYLGNLEKGKYRVYHIASDQAESKISGDRHVVERYYSISPEYAKAHLKFEGMYTSSQPSKLRLGNLPGEEAGKLGLPGGPSTPYMFVTDVKVNVMPKGMTYTKTVSWLSNFAEKGVAYVPSIEFISKAENEAIIPRNSQFVLARTGLGMQFGDTTTIVEMWNPVSDSMAVQLKADGFTVVTGESLVVKSTSSPLSLPDQLLSVGIAPPSMLRPSINLSDSEVSRLAIKYGISKSEVRSIISSLNSAISSSKSTAMTSKRLSEALSSSAPSQSVPPPTEVLPAKLKLPQLTSEQRRYGQHIILFEVKLFYPGATQRYVIKSKTFHNAAQNALMRRNISAIPRDVRVRVIKND